MIHLQRAVPALVPCQEWSRPDPLDAATTWKYHGAMVSAIYKFGKAVFDQETISAFGEIVLERSGTEYGQRISLADEYSQ